MSDINPDLASEDSPVRHEQDTGGPFERPKSRLPRIPQASKPMEFEVAEVAAVKPASKPLSQPDPKLNTHALSVRQYLEASVVEVLMKGLTNLVRERPEDPIEYLAVFLKNNNPHRASGEDEHNS